MSSEKKPTSTETKGGVETTGRKVTSKSSGNAKSDTTKPNAEILPADNEAMDTAEGATQGIAAKALSKVMSNIASNATESQKAAFQSNDKSIDALSKLTDKVDGDNALELAKLIDGAGKRTEKMNKDNNRTWSRLGQYAAVAIVAVVGGSAIYITRGRILKLITKV